VSAPLFTRDLGAGVDLALREAWTVEPLHRLITDNLDRLRRWQAWAHGEQTVEGLRLFTRHQLLAWVDGRNLPCVVRLDGEPVGSVGASLDGYSGTAEIGYWVDRHHEGRGIVSRAVGALVEHVIADRGAARVEIRTSTENARSRALAERLGFTHEGTLRAAMPVGDVRHDVAVYARLAGDRA
jgi:ribosomal-protein-serine acetyltransferase